VGRSALAGSPLDVRSDQFEVRALAQSVVVAPHLGGRDRGHLRRHRHRTAEGDRYVEAVHEDVDQGGTLAEDGRFRHITETGFNL
jgi:hypothetical protein